nr:hypothetical protein [Pandoravirus massiliensis]
MQTRGNAPDTKGSRIGDPNNAPAAVPAARRTGTPDASGTETAGNSRAWALINNTRRQHVGIGSRGECFERDPIRYMRTVLSLGWSADDDMVMLPTRHMDPTYAEVLVWPVASDDAASSSSTGSTDDDDDDDSEDDDGSDDRSDWSDDTDSDDNGDDDGDDDDRAYSSDYDDSADDNPRAHAVAINANAPVSGQNTSAARRSHPGAGSARGQ